MQELNLPKRELKVNIHGEKSVVIRFPKMYELKEYSEKVTAEKADEVEETYLLLEKLGMKKEDSVELEQDSLLELTRIITGQKKI